MIPCMALVIVRLGVKLRKISNKAQLTIAALSAYLNEVYTISYIITLLHTIYFHECSTLFLALTLWFLRMRVFVGVSSSLAGGS